MPSLTVQDKIATLRAGADIIAPVLLPHGFVFAIADSGQSSGGTFAVGQFAHADRRLELHFRYSLGLVRYYLGERGVGHDGYMWVVTGRRTGGSYPGTSDSPLDGFARLHRDIESYCSAFLSGSDAEFLNIVTRADDLWRWYAALPPFQRMEVD